MSFASREGRGKCLTPLASLGCPLTSLNGWEMPERRCRMQCVAERFSLPPNCVSDIEPVAFAIWVIRFAIAFSISFDRLDNKLIGRYPFGVSFGLFGFGSRMHIAFFNSIGVWAKGMYALYRSGKSLGLLLCANSNPLYDRESGPGAEVLLAFLRKCLISPGVIGVKVVMGSDLEKSGVHSVFVRVGKSVLRRWSHFP
jgi:hypothetical protein